MNAIDTSDFVESEKIPNVSYTFDLEGELSAPDLGEVDEALAEIEGVRTRIVHPQARAWISAPESVKPEEIAKVFAGFGIVARLTENSQHRYEYDPRLRRRRRRRSNSILRTLSTKVRRQIEQEDKQAARERAAGFLVNATEPESVELETGNQDVLFTSRALVTMTRLVVAVVFGAPVIVLTYAPSWQFDGWQWLCLLISSPVVLWCAWPFHRALMGGVRRGLTALDGASALAIVGAYLWSLMVLILSEAGQWSWRLEASWFIFGNARAYQPEIFFDVACGITILMLAGRLVTIRNRRTLLELLDDHRPDPHDEYLITKRGKPEERLPLQEVNVGDDIVVEAGAIVPVDGSIIGGASTIGPGVVGEDDTSADDVKVGALVYAGTRNLDREIKVRVHRTGHGTRMAATRRWVSEATRQHNKATYLSTRSAALLIPCAITVALVNFALWWLFSGSVNAAFATSLAVLASVAPVGLALSTALAQRHGIEAAARHGIMLRDGHTFRAIDDVTTVMFNRLGTLSASEMNVQSVTSAEGVNSELVLRVAAALVMDSDHPSSQAIVHAARKSRDKVVESEVPRFIEASRVESKGDGTFVGMVELPVKEEDGSVSMRQIEAKVWRPLRISQVRSTRLSRAMTSGGTPIMVSWKGQDRGVITLHDVIRKDGSDAVEELEKLGLDTMMISRDAYPVARRFADRLGIDFVLAGIAPGKKQHTVRSVRARGATIAMVGDESILEALRVADVGVLMGPTDALNLVDHQDMRSRDHGIEAVLLRTDVSVVPQMMHLARKVCRTVDHNLIFSWGYNFFAIGLSVLGILHPMVATVFMLGSTLYVEARCTRVRKF